MATMTAIETIRASMTERRAVQGEYGARSHLRWLLAWASEPENARCLAEMPTYPPHPTGGHWAKPGLLAAAELVEAGVFRARPTRDPRGFG